MGEDIREKWETGNYVLIPTWEKYLRYISIVGVVSLIFYTGVWTNDSTKNLSTHVESKDIHMPLQEKQQEFITRREYEIILKNINRRLNEISTKLD